MNKKRLWTRGAAWLLTLCLLAGLCVPTVRAEGETETTEVVPEIENTVEADVIREENLVAPLATSRASLNLGLPGLTASYTTDEESYLTKKATATVTLSEKTIVATVQSDTRKPWFGDVEFYLGTCEITFQNTTDSVAKLSFDVIYGNPNCADIVVAGDSTKPTTISIDLMAQQSTTVSIKSQSNADSVKAASTLTIKNIQLDPQKNDYTATFRPSKHGTLLVDGSEITAETSFKKQASYKYKLEAKPDTNAGYAFAGWRNCDTGMIISAENPYNGFQIGEDTTIEPVFVPASSPIFQVDNVDYYDLNIANGKALSGGKLIYLKQGGDLEANTYTISAGVTLLIPYTESTTAHATQPVTTEDEDTNRSAFRKLTMKSGATINVYGTINVDSKMYRKQGGKHSGGPTGQYGQILMYEGTSIVVQSGGNLACWGYITGDGIVRALAGATVRECFEMGDWRGGNVTLEIKNNSSKYKIFPLNQYYIQNIETRYELYSGATEIISTAITAGGTSYIKGQKAESNSAFIAKDEGMFRLGDGAKMVREYNPSNDRTTYTIAPIEEGGTGKFYVGQMTISLKVLGVNPSLASEDFVLPISSNFTVAFEKGITAEILQAQDIAFLPGARFEVAEGATFIASSNMYVYDRESWVDNRYTRDGDLVPVWYSPTKAYTRTKNDLVDGEIDVNGTMIVRGNGKIYTTGTADSGKDFGANIHSSTGFGKIVYETAAQATTTTYQYKENGTDTKYQPISCTAARLRNGDGTYTFTAGAQSGWTYFYDRGATEQWYRFKIQFVMADNPDVIVYQELVASDTASVKLPGLNGTVTTKIAGGTATSEWDAASKTLTLTDINPDPNKDSAPVLKVTVDAAVNSYKPYFVLNEKQYGNYRSYTGETLTDTVDIGGKTYYVVQSSTEPMQFGKKLVGPTDESMGVNGNNHNGITWFLEDTTDGAQVFIGTVPSGETEGDPVYIYGIYSGYEVKVTRNGADEYYTTLKEAVTALPQTGSATVQMLANCGTFEDESKTASYSFIANITFDLNGKEVWGALVNNGTLTLKDSAGGGKIISATTSTTNNPASFAYAIRNNGTLSMENITVVGGSQTNNDYFVGVLNVTAASQQDVSTIDFIKNCKINVTNGYGIYNFSGTINTIDGGSITAKYGIYNRNLRTQGVSSGVYTAIKEGAVATIGTIRDVTVTATKQYALWNGGKIDTICGTSKFFNTGTDNNVVYNSNAWYYDTDVAYRSDETNNGFVRTETRKEEDDFIPTIGTIKDDVEISSSTCSYGLLNNGNIGSIEGNVKISAKSYALAVTGGGKIGSINGNGETGITIRGTETDTSKDGRAISITGQKTKQQKTTYSDKIGGTVTSIETTYYENRPSSIGTITGKVTISTSRNYGIINYGVIDSITGSGVTVQANQYAIYNCEGNRVLTEKESRTNCGTNSLVSGEYLTLREYERTYNTEGPYIGTIDGITITATSSYALFNCGTIKSISNVNATATSNAIYNGNGHFTERKTFALAHGTTELGVNKGHYISESSISYTRLQPTIGSITGTTATTTSAYGALVNTGVIKKIDGCTLTANTYNALSNSLCGTGYYLGNKASTYAEYKQFILLEGSKYVFRPLDSTTSYTRGEIRTITNTKITAKKVSDWCAALDNNGKIGTIGTGTVVKVESAATTSNKDRTYGIRVYYDCYVTRRDVYKDVTETIKTLGVPTSGQYYRQDEFYNTYDDNIYPEVGSISGATVTNAYGYGILNYSKIGSIENGTNVSSYQRPIYNTDGRFVATKDSVQLRRGTSAYATTTSVFNEANYLYSRQPAEITLIDGAILEATGTNYGVYNRGHIGTIRNSTITTVGDPAIRNEDKTNLTYQVTATGNSVDGLNSYIAWDNTKGYVFVTSVTNSYDATCKPAVIDLIGEGNTLTAKANTIYNAGTITEIDGGTEKTSVTATGGVGIYNYRGAYLSESFVAGKATYTFQSASIGTITNTVVSATAQALVNGDGNSAYPAVKINGLGEGNVFTSQNSNGVTNNIYASIGAISGGIYTAGGSSCGLQNNNASAAIDISATTESGPYFKGGTSDRAHAISDPDNRARQTYPAGYTLSGVTRSATVNGTAADGYYFVTKNEFTIVFDGNPATTVSGSVASMTVSRTATSVTLPSSGFTREGFEQVGWALDASTGADSGDLLGLGATVTLARLGNPTAGAEVPLYAVWKPNKTYSITVTWNGDLSYTYTPAVYRWNGATMKYELKSAASWSSTLGTGKWPSVTVTNAGTDSTKEGTVAVTIAYTRATNYNELTMGFTVNGSTTPGSATLSDKLTLGASASATMKLTGTPPNETANGKVVGSVKLTLTPTDG